MITNSTLARAVVVLITVLEGGASTITSGTAAPPNEDHGRIVCLDLITDGAVKRIGSYAPWSVTLLDDRPKEILRLPDDLGDPTFGVFEFGSFDLGDRRIFVLLDEPQDRPARLFVDVNRNGDFTDDPPAEWRVETKPTGDDRTYTVFAGSARIPLGSEAGPSVRIGFSSLTRETRTEYDREPSLDRYRDYARAGTIDLDGESYEVMLDDGCVLGDFRGHPEHDHMGVELLIDVNRNGEFDVRGEAFDITELFNIGGTTYEISEMKADGSSFRLSISSQHVEEIPPPPDLRAGRKILSFEATTLDGRPIRFPDDYRGRIVLLDLWAMWCGWCVRELPAQVEAFEKYHDRGFDIVSISIDAADKKTSLVEFVHEHEMNWTHVLDDGGWDGRLVQLYCPGGIPAGYLVDGTTGTILAALRDVRGEKLAPAIERAFRDRQADPDDPADSPR
jgi:thiol-disulfide isomerase/thioredoxin